MPPIQWLASFEMGHGEIDRQHRQLVDELVGLEGELAAGQCDTANARCRALRHQLESHLKYEEQLLADLGFPRLAEHLESHAKALRKIDVILAECRENCPNGLKLDCTTRWYAAVLHHVLLADLDFKSHLQTKGIISNHRNSH